jgi:PleD family two-component response regulator
MTMKILIVDDSDSQRKILKSILEEYEVFEAYGGLSAIESATKNLPDVIIMKIIMPVVGGFSALKILKSNEQTKNIPIIMTSEKGNDFETLRVAQLGGAELLVKPFTNEKVLEVLKIASIPYLNHCLEKELESSNQIKSSIAKI